MPAADPGPIAGRGDSSPGGWVPGDAAAAGPAGSGPAPSARMPGALDPSDLQGILDLARESDMAAGDPLGEDSAEVTLSDAGCRWSTAQLAGAAAEDLPPGAGLGYWVDCFQPAQMSDFALPAAAAACRRLASWAQAVELEMVAEIAARAAARDAKVPVYPDGRPGQVPVEAAAEVSLALRMSQFGASCWTDLAVTLAWRLAGSAAALRAGLIDLTRARLIAEATSVLDDRGAALAENRVLPHAGIQTPAQLRAALRRAVMSVDPAAAERRREEAERRAKVNLYGDEEGTATLSGQNLPAVHAAAAMARITALARAMKSSGAGGGIDLLRAQVYIGLLLGTLPLIPPAEGAPPGPPDDHPDPPDEGSGSPDEPPIHSTTTPIRPMSPPALRTSHLTSHQALLTSHLMSQQALLTSHLIHSTSIPIRPISRPALSLRRPIHSTSIPIRPISTTSAAAIPAMSHQALPTAGHRDRAAADRQQFPMPRSIRPAGRSRRIPLALSIRPGQRGQDHRCPAESGRAGQVQGSRRCGHAEATRQGKAAPHELIPCLIDGNPLSLVRQQRAIDAACPARAARPRHPGSATPAPARTA